MAAVLPSGVAPLLACRQRSVLACSHRRPVSWGRVLLPQRRCCTPPVYTAASGIEAEAAEELREIEAEDEFDDADDGVGLTTRQVEAFLQTLCEDTEIAELELKMGSFSMKVRRSLSGGVNGAAAPVQQAASPPASPVATQSLDMSQFQLPGSPTATQSVTSFDEEDESLVMIEAPKVGVLRRGKYIKGKKVGKGNIVEEGDTVKKGQTVAFVEQLGTFVPVESPQAGEIVGFVVEEGKPVEYGEVVVELAPFFGGHIIGDQKYA